MSYDQNNIEADNWQLVQISKVTDDTIERLAQNLKLELSDTFFLSYESLLKLGVRAEPFLKSLLKESKINSFKEQLILFALNCNKKNEIKDPIIIQLYHPDFIIRARAIMKARELDDIKYLDFILPLINDPDDSVRWAAVSYLITNHISNPEVRKTLKERQKQEPNEVISRRIKDNL